MLGKIQKGAINLSKVCRPLTLEIGLGGDVNGMIGKTSKEQSLVSAN